MIEGVIVSHGNLAHELAAAASKIADGAFRLEAVTIEWDDSVEEARGKIRVSLERLEPNEGVIVFTDMFGGTPSNICLSFFEKDRIEVITGVNLPMVIKFGSSRENGLGLNEMAKAIQERGARSIRVASEILADSPGGS